MVKQVYYYEISPGDRDHLPAYYFTSGVISAEPEEIEQLKADIESRHPYLLHVAANAEDNLDGIDALKAEIARGLTALHGDEVKGDGMCAEDAPYVAAAEAEREREAAEAAEAAEREDYG